MELFLDRSTGRLRALWRLAIQFGAYWVLGTLVFNVLVVALLLAVWGGRIPPEGLDAAYSSDYFAAVPLASGVASLVVAFLSVWLAGRFLDRRTFSDFGFRLGARWWLDLLFGLCLGALLMTVVLLVELGLGWVEVKDSFETHGRNAPFVLSILFPVATFICVGISEELVTRGYQLKNAAEGLNYAALGPRGAILLAWISSSAFFGVLHANNPNANPVSTLNIVLAGLMLGYGYVLTGELAIPIGLHITWNFFQGSVYGFPVSGLGAFGPTFLDTRQGGPDLWTGGPFGPEGGLLIPAVMLLGMVLTALWTRLRTGKVSLHIAIAEDPDHESREAPARLGSGE